MSGSLCHVLNGNVDVDPEHVVGDEADEDKDGNMHPPDYDDGDEKDEDDAEHGKDKRVIKMKMPMTKAMIMAMAMAMTVMKIWMPIEDKDGF